MFPLKSDKDVKVSFTKTALLINLLSKSQMKIKRNIWQNMWKYNSEFRIVVLQKSLVFYRLMIISYIFQ